MPPKSNRLESDEGREREMREKNIGPTFDSWLCAEGLFEKVSASTANRIAARRAEDVRRINDAADEPNSEVADVLKDQTLGE